MAKPQVTNGMKVIEPKKEGADWGSPSFPKPRVAG